MKKTLFILFSILYILGCSEKENDLPITGGDIDEEKRDLYKEFCDNYCYGCHVKDTTDLVVYNKLQKNERIYLLGSSRNRIWLGIYDIETKEHIKEYIGEENLLPQLTFNKGYGEIGQIKIIDSFIDILYIDDNGFVCYIDGIINSALIFFQDKQIKMYMYEGDRGYGLLEWYDDSFLFKMYVSENNICVKNGWTVFSKSGYVIFTVDNSDHFIPGVLWMDGTGYGKDYIPVSYTEYAFMTQKYSKTNWVLDRENIETGNRTGGIILYEYTENLKFDWSFNEIIGDTLKISAEITDLEGNKNHENFNVNVNSWELFE